MTLVQLVSAVKSVCPAAVRVRDYSVIVEDGAASLADWNIAIGVEPTIDQLNMALASIELASAKQQQLVMLNGFYGKAKAMNVPCMGTSFLADPSSQQIFGQALTVYKAVGSVPDGFFAADAAGNRVPMTLDQLQSLCVCIAAQVNTAFQRWVAVQEALAAATTLAEVQAVVW